MIDEGYILAALERAESLDAGALSAVMDRAEAREPLSHDDIAALICARDEGIQQRIFALAGKIKKEIYGNRVVIFAPLYLSDFCVNNCVYCGYKKGNRFPRRRLAPEEITREVKILLAKGHKRLALEYGEDDVNCPIEYILESIDAVYDAHADKSEIRRVNINIAATTEENYRRLKEHKIGTYILFQETYHRPTYEKMHVNGPKGDYRYHLEAFDRAMTAGIDDVGAGVLFGLYDYRFEVLSLLLHNEHLERTFGAGFHTISVPRLKKAAGNDLKGYPHLVGDEDFKKVIAVLRIAVPYTGIILSTRETAQFRTEAIHYGVSQISAGSATGVGAYRDEELGHTENLQFELSDNRSMHSVLKGLIGDGFIPSFCTACYRKGRTGDRFFELARSGEIKNVCTPNAIMTLLEYISDYGDEAMRSEGLAFVKKSIAGIESEEIRRSLEEQTEKIMAGKRDLYF